MQSAGDLQSELEVPMLDNMGNIYSMVSPLCYRRQPRGCSYGQEGLATLYPIGTLQGDHQHGVLHGVADACQIAYTMGR